MLAMHLERWPAVRHPTIVRQRAPHAYMLERSGKKRRVVVLNKPHTNCTSTLCASSNRISPCSLLCCLPSLPQGFQYPYRFATPELPAKDSRQHSKPRSATLPILSLS